MTPIESLKFTCRSLRIAGVVVAGGLLACLPLMSIGCGHKVEAVEKNETVEVVTTYPKKIDLTREIDQPGWMVPYEITPIYTKIAGYAKEPRYDIGDWVKKGELLVELYVPEVVTELEVKDAKVVVAEADLKQATAAEEAARADVDAKLAAVRSADADVKRWDAEVVRAKKLLVQKIYDQQTTDEQINQFRSSSAKLDEANAKWISAKAVDDKAKADILVAQANIKLAVAARNQWADWLSYRYITAPYDGIVTLLNVHTGHFLQPVNSGSTTKTAEPLFMMMRTDIMRCTIDVPELDAKLVREGDKAIITPQAMPDVDIAGTVTRFTYSLDEKSRTLRVEVHLKNTDGLLLPYMYANVKIFSKLPNATMLPTDAVLADILADNDKYYCYIVEGGKAHKTFLQVGARCEEGVQVLRKQTAGGKWVPLTGQEHIVVDPPKTEDGAPSKMVGPKALLDDQAVELKTP